MENEILAELRAQRVLLEETTERVRRMERLGRVSFWAKVVIWALVLIVPFLLIGPIIEFFGSAGGDVNSIMGLPSREVIEEAVRAYRTGEI